MQASDLKRLLLVGRLEALSFLVLLGIAMPLKHAMGMPLATKLAGWPHGVLFLVYACLVLDAAGSHGFSRRLTAGLLIAALLPFGPFVAERYLRRWAGAAH